MRELIRIPLLSAAILAASIGTNQIVQADELRSLKTGETIPDLMLRELGGEDVSLQQHKGDVVVLVFLSAQQRSSEEASVAAHKIVEDFNAANVELLFATADTAQTAYFRTQRDTSNVHDPLLLDFERELYGELGLIVLPTTIVVDRDGRLAHVISGFKSDYRHVLESYILHATGELTDEELERALESESFQRNQIEDKIARHRSAAKLLRNNSLYDDARSELEAALAIDPDHEGALLDLASLQLSRNEIDEAAALIDRVLEASPSHRRATVLHGMVLFHQDRLDEAEQVLRKALALNPNPVPIHYYLGRIYEARDEPAKAAEHYREALDRLLEDQPV
jgi:tetratricopeptide (TPR) repeat protein